MISVTELIKRFSNQAFPFAPYIAIVAKRWFRNTNGLRNHNKQQFFVFRTNLDSPIAISVQTLPQGTRKLLLNTQKVLMNNGVNDELMSNKWLY